MESSMMFSTTVPNLLAHLAIGARAAPQGRRLASLLRRLVRRPEPSAPARDRVREASEVRNWAMTMQRTDPRFADDLFAAADRHERDEP